jgi:hypothetical protein
VAVDRLLRHVSHWTPQRWAATADDGGGARADLMYALVQELADASADAEQRPRRAVPRAADLLLPDQLRVMALDLALAEPGDAVLDHATRLVSQVARRL